jgi:hypothetical protein
LVRKRCKLADVITIDILRGEISMGSAEESCNCKLSEKGIEIAGPPTQELIVGTFFRYATSRRHPTAILRTFVVHRVRTEMLTNRLLLGYRKLVAELYT